MPFQATPRQPFARQRGVSLLFAIMALVVLSLSSIALVRSVDLGTLVVGNLGFKQDTTAASGSATAEALGYLQSQIAAGNSMDADAPAAGYYASSLDKLDPTGGSTSAANPLAVVDWFGDGYCLYLAAGTFSNCMRSASGANVNGNTVRWVITRLCKKAEAMSPTNPCSKPASASLSTAYERGTVSPGGRPTGVTSSPYYRVIVRTQGPRNTVSYTESLVHL